MQFISKFVHEKLIISCYLLDSEGDNLRPVLALWGGI